MTQSNQTRYFTPLASDRLPPLVEPSAAAWDAAVDPRDLALNAPRNRWLKPALVAVVGVLVAIGIHQAVGVVLTLDAIHPLLGIAGAGLFAAALGVAGTAVWRARGVLADQRALTCLREQSAALRDSRRCGEFTALAEALRQFYDGKPQLPALEATLGDMRPDWEDGEALLHLEARFLAPLEAQAEARVRQVAVQSGTLVAFSPWILMDMVLVLWRALSLLDEIGRIHGVRGSTLGRWVLLKRVLAAMAAAGASELVIDQLVERSSNRLLAGLSGAAAQGLGCGLYTARLGYVAIQVSRPVPPPPAMRSRLGELYRMLSQQLLSSLRGRGDPD